MDAAVVDPSRTRDCSRPARGCPEVRCSAGDRGRAASWANDRKGRTRCVRHPPDVEIRIEVSGEAPPAKGEAKSMLAQAHPQSRRVRRLLTAASTAMCDREPLAGGISLDVTLTAPAGQQLPDASNMLGGIGDVLQARLTGADVEHLGALSSVACFYDDAQIQEIHYRRMEGTELGYVIVISRVVV